MHLVQILLPLYDKKGHAFPKVKLDAVATELTDKFGGVTAFTRTPAEGRWKEDGEQASKDDIIVVEVMVDDLDREWWRQYREGLEGAFKQESIVVRAEAIELI